MHFFVQLLLHLPYKAFNQSTMGPLMLTVLLYHLNKQYHNASLVIFGHMLDPKRDLVLITGGASGLGHELAKVISAKGTPVIVADIKEPPEHQRLASVAYLKCDVSVPHEVITLQETIQDQFGIVTVLINNAGIVQGKPIVELSFDEIEQTIKVNLLASFYTVKVFLPAMISERRGYIVTVALILGYMSPARLGDYGASKSGLIALHESLTYELGPPSTTTTGVKTLLICPGQLKTEMFGSVRTPSSLLAPELDPKYVARSVLRALELGRRGEIKLPMYGNFLPILRALPWPVVEPLRGFSGIDTSMAVFKKMVNTVNHSEVASVKSTTPPR